MLPYTVGSSESSELSDPYGVWPCESLPNVGRSNCVWSSWVDCSGTVGSGGHARHGRGFGCRGCMRSCRGGRSVLGGWSGWHRRCCVLIGRSSVRNAIRVAVRSVGGCRGWGRSAIRVCGGHCRSRRRHCRCRGGCRIRISGWRRNSRCVRVGRPVPECRSGRIVRLRSVACPGLGRSRCRLPDRRSVRRLDRSSWP